jgi:hypothetical protein
VLYFTLIKNESDGLSYSQAHFVRPRGVKNVHVFKLLIHIDVVEDLLFYHHPRDELLADGKVPWRAFVWQEGRLDGEQDEEDFDPVSGYYGARDDTRWHHRDDEDDDRERKGQDLVVFQGTTREGWKAAMEQETGR